MNTRIANDRQSFDRIYGPICRVLNISPEYYAHSGRGTVGGDPDTDRDVARLAASQRGAIFARDALLAAIADAIGCLRTESPDGPLFFAGDSDDSRKKATEAVVDDPRAIEIGEAIFANNLPNPFARSERWCRLMGAAATAVYDSRGGK